MFIQSVVTPNANALKFFPGGPVMTEGVYDFTNAEAAEISPLASALFSIDGVEQVFYGSDFISVTKRDDIEWSTVKPQVIMAIISNYKEDSSLFTDEQEQFMDIGDPGDDPISQQVVSILRKYVLPRLLADGGHIEFKGVKDGVLCLKLRGACASCPSSSMTLKHGIKSLVMAYVPEITDVVEFKENGDTQSEEQDTTI